MAEWSCSSLRPAWARERPWKSTSEKVFGGHSSWNFDQNQPYVDKAQEYWCNLCWRCFLKLHVSKNIAHRCIQSRSKAAVQNSKQTLYKKYIKSLIYTSPTQPDDLTWVCLTFGATSDVHSFIFKRKANICKQPITHMTFHIFSFTKHI